MSNILDELGIDQETYDNGEAGAVAQTFEALESGVYDGTVKEIVIFKNKWDGTEASYTVSIKKGKEPVDFRFRRTIGEKLKDGKPNKGYAGRLKQFAYATGTELTSLSMGSDTTFKHFGTECKGSLMIGMNGKNLKVLLRKSDDIGKTEGESYKITNDVMGVVAMDGTDADGEDAEKAFLETCKKTPIFLHGKKSKGNATAATNTATAEEVEDLL